MEYNFRLFSQGDSGSIKSIDADRASVEKSTETKLSQENGTAEPIEVDHLMNVDNLDSKPDNAGDAVSVDDNVY